MREIHIINPSAGLKKRKINIPDYIEVYESKCEKDVEEFIYKTASECPDTHFTVYGGDGTIYEAVNGIMRAGEEASEKAILSVIPMGTGNDFVKNFSKNSSVEKKFDLIKVNDRYCANMINIGFDCDVVETTAKIKRFPLTSGSFGYILGVIFKLFGKLGLNLDIELIKNDGSKMVKKGKYLLCAIANGAFCGGGFKSNPAAKIDDGLFDAMIVEEVKKSTFIKLVGGYRKGTHVDSVSSEVSPKYKSLLSYYQCAKMTVKNIKKICIDGEIIYTDIANISIIPKALKVKMPGFNIFEI